MPLPALGGGGGGLPSSGGSGGSLPSSGGGGGLPPLGGSSGGGLPGSKKSGGGGGILGAVKHFLGNSVKNVTEGASTVGQALGGAQQLLFHGIQAGKDVAHGQYGEAGKEVGNLAKITASAGGALPVPFTGGVKPISFTQTVGAKKLPFGLETLGSIVTDPLTYATLGTGTAAKAGTEALEAAGEHGLANTIREQGLKALSPVEKQTVRDILVDNAKDVPAAQAQKIADSQLKQMAQRGTGGLGFHIPGTEIGGHVAGSFDPNEALGKLGQKFPGAAAVVRPGAEEAFTVGKGAAAESLDKAGNKVFNTMRSQMLAFPGTVMNRARRGITMNLLDDIGPAEQIAKGREYLKLSKLGAEAEAGVGLKSGELDTEIHKVMEGSQKAVAKNMKAGVGQGGLFPVHPLSYKEGLEQVLAKKGITMDMYKSELARAGVDADKFINLRQIMATSGHNLYSEAAKESPEILKSGPVHSASDFLKEHYTGPIKKAGTTVENFNRGVSALANLDRFGNAEQAALHVEKIVGNPWNLSAAEQKVKFASPFVGSIRSHATGVAQAFINNPAPLIAAHHVLGDTPFSTGSGNPVESAIGIGDIGGKLIHLNVKEAGDAIGNLTGGPTAATFRLLNNAHAMPKSKFKQLEKVITTLSPSLSRLPTHGKKGSLLEQVERFVAGISTQNTSGTTHQAP